MHTHVLHVSFKGIRLLRVQHRGSDGILEHIHGLQTPRAEYQSLQTLLGRALVPRLCTAALDVRSVAPHLS
jgi:hypothetical protein